ncbi:glycosyltransferase family 2 protein [Agromyces ramosus]|uniref:Glycosyl transferase family 2 n=1 Tax=Agromyces ramosus TaxID=33879 RepID=A0ABU0REC3_9MICO|nr:glycosyltransferase family 2 protein [Agromyces ramosus]MDQ0895404.1 hypothetical protein [Agromyces ramosus]
MTLMVRDEADIVGAMLAHHRAQGIDHVIVTDNASVDNTLEVLESFERDGFVTIWHDPEHRKEQWRAVTRMARHAATELGADWVLNADADEFWVAREGFGTVRDALGRIPDDVSIFAVPVVNLTGSPARVGSGLRRLTLRDQRDPETVRTSGIPFHPTPNAVHRGSSEVSVAQGNHRAEVPGWSDSGPRDEIEVLHLPWRSWRQYEYKVRVSGEAYLSNPTLAPSPRHHGMLDFRRLNEGWLEDAYVAKHPSPAEVAAGLADGSFREDVRLKELERDDVPGLVTDVLYEPETATALRAEGRRVRLVELRGEEELGRVRAHHDLAVSQRDDAERRVDVLTSTIDDLRSRGLVRAAWRVDEALRRRADRGRRILRRCLSLLRLTK